MPHCRDLTLLLLLLIPVLGALADPVTTTSTTTKITSAESNSTTQCDANSLFCMGVDLSGAGECSQPSVVRYELTRTTTIVETTTITEVLCEGDPMPTSAPTAPTVTQPTPSTITPTTPTTTAPTPPASDDTTTAAPPKVFEDAQAFCESHQQRGLAPATSIIGATCHNYVMCYYSFIMRTWFGQMYECPLGFYYFEPTSMCVPVRPDGC